MDPLFSKIILNDRKPDCPQSGPLSLAGEPASPGSSTVPQILQRRTKLLQRGGKPHQRRATLLQRGGKPHQRRANPHQKADTQSSAGPRPSLDKERAFEEPMTITDTKCPKENPHEEGKEENLEFGNASFLMYLDEFCNDENFVRNVDSILDMRYLDSLCSSGPEPVDLLIQEREVARKTEHLVLDLRSMRERLLEFKDAVQKKSDNLDSADSDSVTPVTATPVRVTPVRATPVSVTPVRATPVRATPVSVTPVRATPVSVTPVRATPVSVTPVTATPASVTPVNVTPVSATPVNATPVSVTPVSVTPVTKEPPKGETVRRSVRLSHRKTRPPSKDFVTNW